MYNHIYMLLALFAYLIMTIAAVAFASRRKLMYYQGDTLLIWLLYIIFWPIVLIYNVFYWLSGKITWRIDE